MESKIKYKRLGIDKSVCIVEGNNVLKYIIKEVKLVS